MMIVFPITWRLPRRNHGVCVAFPITWRPPRRNHGVCCLPSHDHPGCPRSTPQQPATALHSPARGMQLPRTVDFKFSACVQLPADPWGQNAVRLISAVLIMAVRQCLHQPRAAPGTHRQAAKENPASSVPTAHPAVASGWEGAAGGDKCWGERAGGGIIRRDSQGVMVLSRACMEGLERAWCVCVCFKTA